MQASAGSIIGGSVVSGFGASMLGGSVYAISQSKKETRLWTKYNEFKEDINKLKLEYYDYKIASEDELPTTIKVLLENNENNDNLHNFQLAPSSGNP